MRLLIVLTLLFPGQLDAMSLMQWKVEQPQTYMFYNGQYIPLNVPGHGGGDASSSSFLDALNPFRFFDNIWSSLPSLNPFASSDPLEQLTHSAIPSNTLTTSESDSVGLDSHLSALSSTGFLSSFLPSFGWPSFLGGSSESSYGAADTSTYGGSPDTSYGDYGSSGGLGLGALHGLGSGLDFAGGLGGIGDLGGIGALGGIGGLGGMGGLGNFMKRKDTKDKGPVQYAYVPQGGQGGFFRYEIPVTKPTPSPNQQNAPESAGRPAGPSKSAGSDSGSSDDSKMEDPFPCPTYGQWTYDGVMCTALVPFPKWACKPKDLLATGRVVLCRNKVYLSK